MIKNSKELAITQEQKDKFEVALNELLLNKSNSDDFLFNLQANALKGQIETLNAEIVEFQNLKSPNGLYIAATPFEKIHEILIKTRIAKGISQAELAEIIGTTQQQINKYEATDYETASKVRLYEIADALGLNLSFESFCLFKPQFDLPDNKKEQFVKAKYDKLITNGALLNFCN